MVFSLIATKLFGEAEGPVKAAGAVFVVGSFPISCLILAKLVVCRIVLVVNHHF